MVQEYADSEDADKQEDKVMAQRLLDILYATEDGFAVPAGDNEEFWGDNYTYVSGCHRSLQLRGHSKCTRWK